MMVFQSHRLGSDRPGARPPRESSLPIFVFKLRCQQELDALLDEVSALGGRKLVDSYYREATKKPYSFLHIRLDQSVPQLLERVDFVLEP